VDHLRAVDPASASKGSGSRGLRNGGAKIPDEAPPWRAYSFVIPPNKADRREATTMEDHAEDKWLSRQELAERYGLPVKTPAEWASKGTGPRYAKFGRHVRYCLSDVMDWERKQFAEEKRHPA
jgi:predicted DNA-binding transcriptional regulator AlpA